MQFIQISDLGYTDTERLKTIHYFSFGQYFDPDKTGFGVLRALNDTVLRKQTGLSTHTHKNIELITYVVEGALSHRDSIQNESTIYRGDVQYMSAGSGVMHSEFNHEDYPLRLLEIWIFPEENDSQPNYGEYCFWWDARINNWLHLVSSNDGAAPIKVTQDVNCYVTYLQTDSELDFEVQAGRQAYVLQLEGLALINGQLLAEHVALACTEEALHFKAETDSHIFIIEMKKED